MVSDTRAAERAHRRAAEAEIGFAAPIAEVVSRLFAGKGIVGDLVVAKAAPGQHIAHREERLRDAAVVGERKATSSRELAELGARLDRQLVAGEVT